MIIAIASGKGGTGKTTVAAALARVWETPLIAVDMDVEEPNLHLFLRPRPAGTETADLEVPVADLGKCDGCKLCSALCAFKAIAVFGTFPTVFAELCHGCGGCLAVCPRGALRPGSRELGTIAWGEAGPGLRYLGGTLRVGEAMSPPLMRRVRARLRQMLDAEPQTDVLLDSPPGTSCPAVEAARDADAVLLVTEPTPFGLHDLDLAHRTFLSLGKPMAVVINRAGLGDGNVHALCRRHNLPVLETIPFDRGIAEAYARGIPLDQAGERHRAQMVRLAAKLRAFARAQPAELADA